MVALSRGGHANRGTTASRIHGRPLERLGASADRHPRRQAIAWERLDDKNRLGSLVKERNK
jgi:hypothetical protein